MRFELRQVSLDSIPNSLRKAHQYRLLNEPSHAESICRDVLNVDAHNQQALDILALALTDQFWLHQHLAERFAEAMALRARLTDPYRRAYLTGLILERRAMAMFHHDGSASAFPVYEGLLSAMEAYERAIQVSPNRDDNAILRWNACVRILRRHPVLARQDSKQPSPSDLRQPARGTGGRPERPRTFRRAS